MKSIELLKKLIEINGIEICPNSYGMLEVLDCYCKGYGELCTKCWQEAIKQLEDYESEEGL